MCQHVFPWPSSRCKAHGQPQATNSCGEDCSSMLKTGKENSKTPKEKWCLWLGAPGTRQFSVCHWSPSCRTKTRFERSMLDDLPTLQWISLKGAQQFPSITKALSPITMPQEEGSLRLAARSCPMHTLTRTATTVKWELDSFDFRSTHFLHAILLSCQLASTDLQQAHRKGHAWLT